MQSDSSSEEEVLSNCEHRKEKYVTVQCVWKGKYRICKKHPWCPREHTYFCNRCKEIIHT